mmetsp:Transcript_18277/g.58772  ORF Transcript_18277/g.58772 Transcript_18277/m.58772 type:complete len:331 (+) Transcript_18277:587-1579(+)
MEGGEAGQHIRVDGRRLPERGRPNGRRRHPPGQRPSPLAALARDVSFGLRGDVLRGRGGRSGRARLHRSRMGTGGLRAQVQAARLDWLVVWLSRRRRRRVQRLRLPAPLRPKVQPRGRCRRDGPHSPSWIGGDGAKDLLHARRRAGRHALLDRRGGRGRKAPRRRRAAAPPVRRAALGGRAGAHQLGRLGGGPSRGGAAPASGRVPLRPRRVHLRPLAERQAAGGGERRGAGVEADRRAAAVDVVPAARAASDARHAAVGRAGHLRARAQGGALRRRAGRAPPLRRDALWRRGRHTAPLVGRADGARAARRRAAPLGAHAHRAHGAAAGG